MPEPITTPLEAELMLPAYAGLTDQQASDAMNAPIEVNNISTTRAKQIGLDWKSAITPISVKFARMANARITK